MCEVYWRSKETLQGHLMRAHDMALEDAKAYAFALTFIAETKP